MIDLSSNVRIYIDENVNKAALKTPSTSLFIYKKKNAVVQIIEKTVR